MAQRRSTTPTTLRPIETTTTRFWVEWLKAKKHLQPALDRAGNTHTLNDILKGVLTGIYQFWPGKKCAGVTEIIQHPQCRVLLIYLAGGDLEELSNMLPSVRAFGKENNCTRMTIYGRPGWERSLGFRKTGVILEKTI